MLILNKIIIVEGKMKNKKIIFSILIIFLIFFVCGFKVYATDSIIQGADEFLEKGDEYILNMSSIKKVSDTLFNIFSILGTAFVVIVGAILGIQFITASPEGKAEIKEKLIPYTVGSVVIFGAVGIWNIAIGIMKNIEGQLIQI